jgi:hypothetical protein
MVVAAGGGSKVEKGPGKRESQLLTWIFGHMLCFTRYRSAQQLEQNRKEGDMARESARRDAR